jgi:hypothetical protein
VSSEQPYNLIAVKNESGDELVVYEYWLARTFFGMVDRRRLKLSTGEEVVPIDDGSFMVALTGERLTRITARPRSA